MFFANVPGLWLVASLVGAVGVAMQMRWILTRTIDPKARTRGLMKAALVEGVGLVLLVFSATGQGLIVGMAVTLGVGLIVGAVAAKALRPPP